MVNRRQFLTQGAFGLGGLFLFSSFRSAPDEKPAQLENSLVRDFVGKAHRDKDAVVKMFAEHPTLLNAAYDHGGGDFETALGAASHVGYTELVTWLVENGAQMNFLTLCLLGKTEIVKSMLDLYPHLIHMKGPHGFTPLHHANNGGEDAAAVKKLLEERGAVETKVKLIFPVIAVPAGEGK
ncbi:MAG TPA: ankyrin repeat domain-containing protein [Bacteroidia bacterium]|nr:ankyrin repeat domain-containing protein [Bacteroidia bacterium]